MTRSAPRCLLALCAILLASPAPGRAGESLETVAILRDEIALHRAHDIEVREGVAYLAGKGGSLAIVDVSQPAKPRMLWSVRDAATYEEAETVLPLGPGRLLVGARDALLFDVADPARPESLAKIEDRARIDLINGFARLGDTVFGANKTGHLLALDVAAADTIRLLGARDTRAAGELTAPHDVACCGDLLAAVSPEAFGRTGLPGRLGVFRVADPVTGRILPPERWALAGRIDHPRLAGANRVQPLPGRLVCAASSLTQNLGRADGWRGNVSAVDLTDPAQPRLRGGVDFPDPRGPNGLAVAGRVAFAAGGQTVLAVDFTDPDAPRELARLTSPEAFPGGEDDAHDLVYAGGHLFITAQNSHALVVLRVADERIRRAAEK